MSLWHSSKANVVAVGARGLLPQQQRHHQRSAAAAASPKGAEQKEHGFARHHLPSRLGWGRSLVAAALAFAVPLLVLQLATSHFPLSKRGSSGGQVTEASAELAAVARNLETGSILDSGRPAAVTPGAASTSAADEDDAEPDWRLNTEDTEPVDHSKPIEGASTAAAAAAEAADPAGAWAKKEADANLLFDMKRAMLLWDQHVGCDSFRAKHQALLQLPQQMAAATAVIDAVAAGVPAPAPAPATADVATKASAAANDSEAVPVMGDAADGEVKGSGKQARGRILMEAPVRGSLQPLFNSSQCDRLKLKHVTVKLEQLTWLPDWLDTTYTCTCGLTCLFSRSHIIASDPDVLLYQENEMPAGPVKGPGEPLKAFMNLEASGKSTTKESVGENVDIFIGYRADSDIQCTYAANMFHMDHNRYVSDKKRTDVFVFFAVEQKTLDRTRIANELMKHVRTHSVGGHLNNMEGARELDLYPQCTPSFPRDWGSHTHCTQSHYLFTLGIENQMKENYVTEKFFYPLEAGSVPVYYGAPDVENFAPPDSYVKTEGRTYEEIAKEITQAARDMVKYMNYHAWRRCGVLGNYGRARALSLDTLPCRLCEEASRRGGKAWQRSR